MVPVPKAVWITFRPRTAPAISAVVSSDVRLLSRCGAVRPAEGMAARGFPWMAGRLVLLILAYPKHLNLQFACCTKFLKLNNQFIQMLHTIMA